MSATGSWEYGFYDSEDQTRTIYWYVFGFLTHDTAESAKHTGLKSTFGQPVIVRRRRGKTVWEHVEEESDNPADHEQEGTKP